MLKYHRIYNAKFEISKRQDNGSFEPVKVIEIKNPITCNINISVDMAGSANTGVFQFVNLSPEVRADLWYDVFTRGDTRINIEFHAGYGFPEEGKDAFILPLVFSGELKQCISYKQGNSTDWITDVQAFEGGYFYEYGYCNVTLAKGTYFTDLVNYMIGVDKDIKIGYITPDIPPLPRNKTFIGQTMDLLGREYGGYEVFIDRGQFNVLGPNDVIPGELLVITDASGLLGTPKRSLNMFIVDLLFEPQIHVGQAVSLMSESLSQFNQAYLVQSVKHSGIISERESGKLTTQLVLVDLPENIRRELTPAKPTTYTGKTTSKWDKPLKSFRLNSPFGLRIHPIFKTSKFHSGIDMGADEGVPVYAPADGKVSIVGWEGSYGNVVNVNNGKIDGVDVASKFAHLKSWAVKSGQNVFKGKTILGYVGSTGVYTSGPKKGQASSTGPHLHFEVRENGKPVNPTKYIGNI